MFDISALYVWDCLEQAKEGNHPYGGDMAEIYAQHLAPNEPMDDPWKYAGKALYAILKQFCQVNGVNASVDGKPIGDWMNDYRFFHKCDVRIFDAGQSVGEGEGSSGEVQQSCVEHHQGNEEENLQSQGSEEVLPTVLLHGQPGQTLRKLMDEIDERHQKGK